jgi:hypothetical protein
MREVDLSYPVPEPHEIVDEAPVDVVAAVREADADVAAGRFIRCRSEDAFDALLAEFAARPHPQAS